MLKGQTFTSCFSTSIVVEKQEVKRLLGRERNSMEVAIYTEPSDIRPRLAELGLQEETLRDVVRQGYLGFASCTKNHPPLVPAIWAWGETIRALREYLLPLGWRRSDTNNYSLVIDPSERIAIAVATGDDGTGLINAVPSTKSPKGPSTIAAVNVNQLELALDFGPAVSPSTNLSSQEEGRAVTWLLLICRGYGEVRCELSLPSSMDTDGYIDGWRERILLGSIPLDSEEIEIVPEPVPDITIDVRRRA
jgi:hypothetical protein